MTSNNPAFVLFFCLNLIWIEFKDNNKVLMFNSCYMKNSLTFFLSRMNIFVPLGPRISILQRLKNMHLKWLQTEKEENVNEWMNEWVMSEWMESKQKILQPRSQGLSSSLGRRRDGGVKKRDPGNEVENSQFCNTLQQNAKLWARWELNANSKMFLLFQNAFNFQNYAFNFQVYF